MIRYDGVMIDVVKRRGKQGCRYAVATTLQGSKAAVEAHPGRGVIENNVQKFRLSRVARVMNHSIYHLHSANQCATIIIAIVITALEGE